MRVFLEPGDQDERTSMLAHTHFDSLYKMRQTGDASTYHLGRLTGGPSICNVEWYDSYNTKVGVSGLVSIDQLKLKEAIKY